MKVNDRVKYIGEARPDLLNRCGTIIKIDEELSNAEVEFDAFTYSTGNDSHYMDKQIALIGLQYLELIDPKDKKYNRQYSTGATRDVNDYKYDYIGFSSPYILNRYAQYMHEHRIQEDGTLRSSSNWQRGIPNQDYLESMHRHFFDVWCCMEGIEVRDPKTGKKVELDEALCGLKFNVDGLLFNVMKEKNPVMYNGEKQFVTTIHTNEDFPEDTDCCSCEED